jgi:transcriptional regulator with XRE-family HTH domain
MKERIAQIIQKEDMTAAQFAEKIGISPSSLSHILSGRNNPSLEVVMKIHKACDYISLDWLLYGEGQMETDVDSEITGCNQNTGSIFVFFHFSVFLP